MSKYVGEHPLKDIKEKIKKKQVQTAFLQGKITFNMQRNSSEIIDLTRDQRDGRGATTQIRPERRGSRADQEPGTLPREETTQTNGRKNRRRTGGPGAEGTSQRAPGPGRVRRLGHMEPTGHIRAKARPPSRRRVSLSPPRQRANPRRGQEPRASRRSPDRVAGWLRKSYG